MFATVIDDATLIGVDILLHQELFLEAGGNVFPGQHFVGLALAAGVPIHVQPSVGKGLLPRGEVKIFAPAFELGPQFPRPLDHVRQAAVATGEERFD